MLRALYNGMSGILAQQQALEKVSHNMANVNTPGYKSSQASFSDLLYRESQNRRLPVYPTMGALAPQIGKGVKLSSLTTDFNQGSLFFSGRSLDLALEGEGFFRIIRADGTVAYTRNGTFYLDANGRVVTDGGDFLDADFSMEEFMEPPDGDQGEHKGVLHISPEGMAYWVEDEEPRELGQIPIFRFVNTAGLMSEKAGHYLETEASGQPLEGLPGDEGFGNIRQHFIERSNVDLSNEIIELLITQRALQSGVRTVMAADELWDIAIRSKE